jgi:hypothetical protein
MRSPPGLAGSFVPSVFVGVGLAGTRGALLFAGAIVLLVMLLRLRSLVPPPASTESRHRNSARPAGG